MSKRQLKCYGTCNKKYTESEMRYIGKTRYCQECAEVKEIENQERVELYSLIKMYYKISFPTGQMLKQIKSFIEERHYTYRGLILTMKYTFEVDRSFSPVVRFGLSFIPYKYESSRDFYIKQQQQAESIMSHSGTYDTVERKVSKAVIDVEPTDSKKIDMEDLI